MALSKLRQDNETIRQLQSALETDLEQVTFGRVVKNAHQLRDERTELRLKRILHHPLLKHLHRNYIWPNNTSHPAAVSSGGEGQNNEEDDDAEEGVLKDS